MSLHFAILALGDNSELENYIPRVMKSIDGIGGETIMIIKTNYDKEDVKKHLIQLSDDNKTMIVIVIGDTEVVSTCDIAYEAIENVIDKNISNKLNVLISSLKRRLETSFNRAICGIRKQMFVINMCGSYVKVLISLKIHVEIILQIIHSMYAPDKATYSNNNNNNNDNNNNNNNNNDNNSDVLSSRNISEKEAEKIPILISNPMFSVKNATNLMHDIMKKDREELWTKQSLIEDINTSDAYGRILAKDIYSPIDVPCYNTSTKRGYAVFVSDGQDVRKVLTAQSKSSFVPGTCIRVRSGSSIPNGATAVVSLENTKITEEYDNNNIVYFNSDDKEYKINVLITPKRGENIRVVGCQIEIDDHLLEKFARIGSAELGTLALCGCDTIPVFKVPQVGLLSIIDLDEPENNLVLKRINDCNKITLRALLKKNDFNDPEDLGIAFYQIDAIVKKLENALEEVDVLVTMGRSNEKDLLKFILEAHFNATIFFSSVNMKPGKSTMFAMCMINEKKKYLLCMSANPGTVPIVAHVLLLPLLNEMRCNFLAEPINMQACLNSEYKLHSRPTFSWTTLHWMEEELFPRAYNYRDQGILNYQTSNALLLLPPRSSYALTLRLAYVQTSFYGLK